MRLARARVPPSRLLDEVNDRLSVALGGCRAVEAKVLVGGEVNTTVRVRTTDGQDLVLRWGPRSDWHPAPAGSAAAMALASSLGVPVPEVLHADELLFAYRYVEGRPLPAEPGSDTAEAVGRVFGLLHGHPGDGIGPVQPDGSPAGWPPETFYDRIPDWAARITAGPDPIFDPATVAEAVSLVSDRSVPGRARLIHGDAAPHNVLVHDGAVVAVIDFDAAWFGEPAGDLAWWGWNHPDSADAFARGCAATSEPTNPVLVWRHRLHLLLGLADAFAFTNPSRRDRIRMLLPRAVATARRAST